MEGALSPHGPGFQRSALQGKRMLGSSSTRPALLVLIALLLAFLGGRNASPAQSPDPSPRSSSTVARFVPGELIVRFKDEAEPNERANSQAQVSARTVHRFHTGAEHWKLGKGLTTEAAIARLRKNRHVRYIEPNYIRRAENLPNDSLFGQMDARS